MSSIRSSVVEDLVSAVRDIRTEYGFNTDAQEVYPYLTDPQQYPAYMVQEDSETGEYLAYPLIHRRLTLTVYGVNLVRTTSTDRPDRVARDMIADIERAVLRDPTRAGNAVDTTFKGNEVLGVSDDQVGVSVTFEVAYRTHDSDPTRRI